jgi:tRNA(Ile)-lysidine synthase
MILNSKLRSPLADLDVHQEARFLLAVSGGMDSMCLLHLCLENGMNVEVGHVNYGLRGEDSELDEALVRSFCEGHSVPFHVSNWTPDESLKGSIQMQCRDYRYAFFDKVMDSNDLELTLLAHHADDNVETVLLNLFNGTGITGLSGMPNKRDRYYRPLLGVSRADIERYVQHNEVPFRDDVSNFGSKYDRNFVRNNLLPAVGERFEGAIKNIGRSIQNVNSAKQLLDYFDQSLKSKYFLELGTGFTCNLTELKTQPGYQYLLFTWLSKYGFNANQIAGVLDQKTGAEFRADAFRLVVSRNTIEGELIRPRAENQNKPFNFQCPPKGWEVSTTRKLDGWTPDPQEYVGEFDLTMLSQVQIRGWEEGDKFKPLGLNGWKKLSDFFIDEKLSILEKEKVKLVVSNDEIVWVVGMRVDDRFKVNKDTHTVLRVTYNPNS